MCFIFHKWEKWQPYTWKGFITYRKQPDQPISLTEERQKRVCSLCGITQDELI